ncbi:MAG: TVP38/TMEM64 family protein [Blastopirellula sp.]|nr:MAG: TVP38/TMEM64 family protein [Blastopirellula sp.]
MVADDSGQPGRSSLGIKLGVFAVIALLVGGLYWFFGDYLQLEYLAEQESSLRTFFQQNPALTYTVAFLLYVAVTGLSLPGAAGMTLVYGWLFPLVPAFILISFASTSGATLAFLLSRYLFRDAIQNRFGEQLAKFNTALEKEGAFYLFTLRLIPAAPFFVINAVMGLTPMRTKTYWWVSQLGMLPGTAVYVYAGNSIPSLQTIADDGASGIVSIQLLIAFAVLGLFPLVVKKLFGQFSKK